MTIPNAKSCSNTNDRTRAPTNVNNPPKYNPSGYLEEEDLYYDSSNSENEPINKADADNIYNMNPRTINDKKTRNNQTPH